MKVHKGNTTPPGMTVVQSAGDPGARLQKQSRVKVGHFPGANKIMRSGEPRHSSCFITE